MDTQEQISNKTIYLLACVKKKQDYPTEAQFLYQSTWFKKAREFTTQNTTYWYILSAKHGLVEPTTVLSPYDQTLHKMPKAERIEWAKNVYQQLRSKVPPQKLVILAGKCYRSPLVDYLSSANYEISIPMAGLGIGQQLA